MKNPKNLLVLALAFSALADQPYIEDTSENYQSKSFYPFGVTIASTYASVSGGKGYVTKSDNHPVRTISELMTTIHHRPGEGVFGNNSLIFAANSSALLAVPVSNSYQLIAGPGVNSHYCANTGNYEVYPVAVLGGIYKNETNDEMYLYGRITQEGKCQISLALVGAKQS